MVTYEKTTPSTGFFDALGRMYRQIKSRIKYYMGKETKVKKTVEIGEELNVWKMNEVVDGENIVSYRKLSKDKKIDVDSIVYEDGLHSIAEINLTANYVRIKNKSGEELYDIYNNEDILEKSFYIGLSKDIICNSEGMLNSFVLSIKDDTTFLDLEYFDNQNQFESIFFSNTNKSISALVKKNVLFKRLTVDNECHELKEDKDMPNAECPRYDRYSVENYMKEPQNAGRKIFPSNFIQKKNSQKEGPSYGASHVDFSDSFQCVKCDNRYYHVVNNFLFNEKIIVFKSNWIYNEESKSWEEFCWGKKDMQATYNHEKSIFLMQEMKLNTF